MTQSEIMKFLNKHKGKYYSPQELVDNIKKGSLNSVLTNLRRLRRHGEVNFKVTKGDKHIYGIPIKQEEVWLMGLLGDELTEEELRQIHEDMGIEEDD